MKMLVLLLGYSINEKLSPNERPFIKPNSVRYSRKAGMPSDYILFWRTKNEEK